MSRKRVVRLSYSDIVSTALMFCWKVKALEILHTVHFDLNLFRISGFIRFRSKKEGKHSQFFFRVYWGCNMVDVFLAVGLLCNCKAMISFFIVSKEALLKYIALISLFCKGFLFLES